MLGCRCSVDGLLFLREREGRTERGREGKGKIVGGRWTFGGSNLKTNGLDIILRGLADISVSLMTCYSRVSCMSWWW